MPRYYFSLVNDLNFDDVDGLELPSLAAARSEALGLARDLMRLQPERRDWSGCAVRVTDNERNVLFDVPFLETGDG